jgi:hypothetical protein
MTDTNPRDLIQRLANALHDAADDVEGWGNYASSYFQEKHDLSGNVARIHAMADEARAYLSQPEPVPVSADAAFAIGQTGGPPSEVERLAFEAWMRGHSWLVSGKWNGTTYADPQERHSSIDLPAMQTRMLWAAWRDRAALARWGSPPQ